MKENNVPTNDDMNSLTKEELIYLVKEINDKFDLQEALLLNISHDLRNPINVILSVLQCFKYTESERKKEEYEDIIKRNTLKMIKLVDNLIDTTKLEKKFYRLNKKNIDIVSMVENIVDSVEKYAQQKEIQLVFDTNVEECITAADPEAIDRIIMNLLSNAVKFSPRYGHILVNIFINNDKINISVDDDGPGISIEEQKLIFNRFVQSEQNRKNEHSGSGIGLDLVSYLTKAHDGDVKLISKVGKGSKFIVTLPIIKIENEAKCCEFVKKNKVEQLEIEFSDIYL